MLQESQGVPIQTKIASNSGYMACLLVLIKDQNYTISASGYEVSWLIVLWTYKSQQMISRSFLQFNTLKIIIHWCIRIDAMRRHFYLKTSAFKHAGDALQQITLLSVICFSLLVFSTKWHKWACSHYIFLGTQKTWYFLLCKLLWLNEFCTGPSF